MSNASTAEASELFHGEILNLSMFLVIYTVKCASNYLSSFQLHLGHFVGNKPKRINSEPADDGSSGRHCSHAVLNLKKRMQAWKECPAWVDQSPDMKVTIPKGSLCNLNVEFKVGLPPDAVFNILIDPENRRVFKNIKEVISRNVLVDEGERQLVEVEQAATWSFLCWSGTFSVHVCVYQDRNAHTVIFKQGKSGFMKRFEGCWKIEPLFVDEERYCDALWPKTLADYDSCTGGKGRVGSVVSLEQLIQPALVPPPPFSWLMRGVTTRTTEMLINDLIAETARLRAKEDYLGVLRKEDDLDVLGKGTGRNPFEVLDHSTPPVYDPIKERWHRRRRSSRRRRMK